MTIPLFSPFALSVSKGSENYINNPLQAELCAGIVNTEKK